MLDSIFFESASKMDINKEKIRPVLQVFFEKDENVSQAAEVVVFMVLIL